jgi:hypothetical protein
VAVHTHYMRIEHESARRRAIEQLRQASADDDECGRGTERTPQDGFPEVQQTSCLGMHAWGGARALAHLGNQRAWFFGAFST